MESFEFHGRTAVVTGAASGIGKALSAAFGARGCRVVLADVERRALELTADELRTAGTECLPVVTDVSDAASIQSLAEAAVSAYGGVSILCNNAGVSIRKPLAEQTIEDWQWTLGVDLWGVIHGVRTFLPLLMAQPAAHIVNTASVAGLLAFPLGGPYNAAKAAVVALTETLCLELATQAPHVGVSVLCPGATRSRITTSGRNRPAELGPPAPVAPTAEEGDLTRALIEGGLDPALVADQVIEAIQHRAFWVLTHRAEYHASIRARTEAMLAGRNPTPVDLSAILASQRQPDQR